MSRNNLKIQLTANKIKGVIAEQIAKQDYKENGFEIQDTRYGSDFIATKKLGDSIYTEYVDVKSGNAKLTRKQKKTKSQLKKKNIRYTEYRVTDQHLEFQIQNNLELQVMCNDLGFDASIFSGLFLVSDSTFCPNCNLSTKGLQGILTNFGLRNMGDGTVRVQSWCRNCRNYSRRGRK